jgi:flagellar L-ring protein precursor FlgH
MLSAFPPTAAHADQLYQGNRWAGVATDIKAHDIGDTLTVVIFESATATNRVGTRTGKATNLIGGLQAGEIDESVRFGFDSKYQGLGETERSDRFVASMAAVVREVLPNGDLIIVGRQNLLINGERRDIEVRGQVRRVDITANNTVPSSRLANAAINYDGNGFITRSAKPGLINRIFNFLGIG